MPIPAAESALDVALWFQGRARSENEHLQAQKLQRLLFFAQGQYANQFAGRKLMPATFIALEIGPLEPNIKRFFEFGPPNIPIQELSPEVSKFLDQIWRKLGHYSADKLGEMARFHPAYLSASKRGQGEEIPFSEIVSGIKGIVSTPEKLKTADGRLISRWLPPKK